MKKLILVLVVSVLVSGCAVVAPNDDKDLSKGFYTYGFGRDLEVKFYENGNIKEIKATSNVGATIKAGDKVLETVAEAMP